MEVGKPEVTFVLGGPGSGKGTQCGKLVEKHGFIHLSAGDLLREERNSGSKDAELINEYIKEGKIVPVEITCNLLKKAMEANGWDKSRFLIDGFPRSQDNLDGWNEVMGDVVNVSTCLYLNTSEDIMTERILKRAETSGRVDDNEEAVKKRLSTYLESTIPIIKHFEELGKTVEVDSTGEIEDIFST
eukprot:CAMPEP_0196996138 /NCGR_PEP_ID=MMETSP1380-20130617/2102_1 /TAXON_ID=5936 /ORGANISM="Euplotes crassus, Strain CT5" /LENGTH=186 /DNA_ID=CAMNT_0042412021 /DNA_START=12 /DNA_END=568 /DNA_ORIENTATION=+